MALKGFMFPRTKTGKASLLPPPPWHYSGQLLTLEYRADPQSVIELLPDNVEPADDPGAIAVIWADWQCCSDSFEEILDPARGQYKEVFVVARCKYKDVTYSRCLYIWVDTDMAMVRGQLQGYPKKLGSIFMSKPVTVGKAGPRLEKGGRFGASLAAYDRRLLHAEFEITGPSENAGFVNANPMLHSRYFPSVECDGTLSLDELIVVSGYDIEIDHAFKGVFKLDIGSSPVEEIDRLTPLEMIGGYYREVGVSWKQGKTLQRQLPKAI